MKFIIPIEKLNNNFEEIVVEKPKARNAYMIFCSQMRNEIIEKEKRLYLSLATGAGKSIIAYSILNELSFIKTIIILTPRIHICKQNIKSFYINFLKNYYTIYNKNNLHKINNSNYNLICCCIHSYKNVDGGQVIMAAKTTTLENNL